MPSGYQVAAFKLSNNPKFKAMCLRERGSLENLIAQWSFERPTVIKYAYQMVLMQEQVKEIASADQT